MSQDAASAPGKPEAPKVRVQDLFLESVLQRTAGRPNTPDFVAGVEVLEVINLAAAVDEDWTAGAGLCYVDADAARADALDELRMAVAELSATAYPACRDPDGTLIVRWYRTRKDNGARTVSQRVAMPVQFDPSLLEDPCGGYTPWISVADFRLVLGQIQHRALTLLQDPKQL